MNNYSLSVIFFRLNTLKAGAAKARAVDLNTVRGIPKSASLNPKRYDQHRRVLFI